MSETLNVIRLPENQVIDLVVPSLLHARDRPDDVDDFLFFALNFSRLSDLWDHCHRSDWMLWLLKKAGEWRLDPNVISDQILNEFQFVIGGKDLLSMQADVIRESIENPLCFLNETPLIERRHKVWHGIIEGDGPLVSRLVVMFK